MARNNEDPAMLWLTGTWHPYNIRWQIDSKNSFRTHADDSDEPHQPTPDYPLPLQYPSAESHVAQYP